jgi:chaperonin GroEL (HSP60 family)
VAAQVLARALRRLPALLYYSVCPDDRRGWHVEVLPSLCLLHSPEGPWRPCHDHGVLVAASGAGSRVANMREHGMLEPLSAKVQLLQSVVTTVAALLRVDRVIRVKGALRRRTKGSADAGRGAAAGTGEGEV